MSFTKHWTSDGKEMLRGDDIGANDMLDVYEDAWEWQRWEHDEMHTRNHHSQCSFCQAEEEEAKHYERHVFDRIFSTFNGGAK